MVAFPFDLVSPERLLISDQVEGVIAPGSEGEFMILAGHAPFISTLKPGIVTVEGGTAPQRRFFVRGGFAEVTPEKGLTILAEEAIPFEELDAARIAQEIKNAEEDVADASTEETRRKAEERLNRMREIQSALGGTVAAAH
ncbi:ATP synthase epsilon chain [Agaricicola taiwanensis]|uniref:ATP synthase epsilon chain n=1 Tax=Agaricicola taiwanensis TaxID=591372 RepID=A0A8J2YEV7_9RHOB|nr:F0F1 ATP synthase subunit epsilon [Agaricicola taiwanensis]GGE26987.1 ATP synthase epsilon chain [Agaricicola taiwanensis]